MARICTKCGGIRSDTECPRCGVKGNENRGTAHSRGYTSEWAKYSREFRLKWPLCAHCERVDRVTAIAPGDGKGQVDHIIRPPHKGHKLFWEVGNHQGLCLECHGAKTEAEEKGLYSSDQVRRDQEQRREQLRASE